MGQAQGSPSKCTPDHLCLTQEKHFLNPDRNFHAVFDSCIYATWASWI